MRTLEELLDEAKWGMLNQDEINYVVKCIEDHKSGCGQGDLYTLLYIFGVAHGFLKRTTPKDYFHDEDFEFDSIKNCNLVESFLYYPKNNEISNRALITLCGYWEHIDNYFDLLVFFIKQSINEKESSSYVEPHTAISIVGNYLSDKKNRKKQQWKTLHNVLLDMINNEAVNGFIKECIFEELSELQDR